MKQVGPYLVEELIGEGGMGDVYKGVDPRFNRPVTIKVLHHQLPRNQEILDRFKSEAVIQARLQHPGIVTVLDFVLEDNQAAMIMEYIEGATLEQHLKRQDGKMEIPIILEIFK